MKSAHNPTLPLQVLMRRLSCTKVVVSTSPNIAGLVSLWTPIQKVYWHALTPRVQRETCEQCKGGKRACCNLDFFLLLASPPSPFTQIGFLERGVKKGRQCVEVPWECVNSRSRAGAGGGMVLKPCQPSILYKRMKKEMRSRAQFVGVLVPKIILACSKIWFEILAIFFNWWMNFVSFSCYSYPCWIFTSGHDENTGWARLEWTNCGILLGKSSGIKYTRQKMFRGCGTLVLFAEGSCLWFRLSQGARGKWQSHGAAMKA